MGWAGLQFGSANVFGTIFKFRRPFDMLLCILRGPIGFSAMIFFRRLLRFQVFVVKAGCHFTVLATVSRTSTPCVGFLAESRLIGTKEKGHQLLTTAKHTALLTRLGIILQEEATSL
jgi:hypothetical protein